MSREYRNVHEAEDDLANLSPLERAKAEAAHAEAAAAEEQAFFQFFSRHRELDASDANRHVLKNWIGDGVYINLALLEDALKVLLDSDPRHFPLSRRTAGQDEREREEIVEKILDFKNGDSTWEANERARLNLRNPTNKQYTKSLDDLKAILEEAELRAKFQKMSVTELKAFVKKPEPEYPPVPSKWTGPIIKASDPAAIRRLLQVHGERLVNERIQGIS